jgi:hypothetical protein
MNWLPPHKCGLHLTHNDHKNMYLSVEENHSKDQFVNEAEWDKAIREDSVWSLQWYPETPIGFHILCASSLEAIEQAVKEQYT